MPAQPMTASAPTNETWLLPLRTSAVSHRSTPPSQGGVKAVIVGGVGGGRDAGESQRHRQHDLLTVLVGGGDGGRLAGGQALPGALGEPGGVAGLVVVAAVRLVRLGADGEAAADPAAEARCAAAGVVLAHHPRGGNLPLAGLAVEGRLVDARA